MGIYDALMMFLLGGCKWICMNDKFNHKFSDWWISFRSCSMLHDLGYVHTFLLLSWSFFSMLFYMLCMVNKYIVGGKNQTHSFWNKIANITYGRDLIHVIVCCNYFPNEFYLCVSSNALLEKMIYYKIHICNLCGLHELCGYVSSNMGL